MKCRKEDNFFSIFNEKTGFYARSGIIKEGHDTGKDPFMASFPELLDVGIMGHCKHGKSGLCVKAGIECYQDGLHAAVQNMTVEDFKSILEQCRGNTYQIALGGAGDPDQHEHFEEILKLCVSSGVVPNFTTSGLGMTKAIAKLCKKYCGAVAVSWYRSSYTLNAIELLLDEGVKTNIHYVLCRNTIKEAYDRLIHHTFPIGINAIVFLLHKPIGLGSMDNVIQFQDESLKKLIVFTQSEKCKYKIGYDSCTVPALLNNQVNLDITSVDTCEGARWSAYISSDMKMLPCSFDNQRQKWAVDLRKYSIGEAWHSTVFDNFRNHFIVSCQDCVKRNLCLGGCPICPEIVLCERKNSS